MPSAHNGKPLAGYRYWIFDMDGTLTLPIHDFEAIRRELGVAPGAPILEAMQDMPAAQAESVRRRLHELEMELAWQAQPQPEAAHVLERLRGMGGTLGILTRNGREISRATLEAAGLRHYFDSRSIICRDTCAPKPSPEGVKHLLRLWNAPRSQAIIVGDYVYDMQAGHEAGIGTVHFDPSGNFPWPRYTRHRISRLGEIAELV